MERINRPGDDFRESLSVDYITEICRHHDLPSPITITPESRGNEKVIYHLDEAYSLQFCLSENAAQNVEALTILSELEEVPTPQVIALIEEDPVLQVPYFITERCPGIRLDKLWSDTQDADKVSILEALGTGMGRYHTVTASKVHQVAAKHALNHRILDQSDQQPHSSKAQDISEPTRKKLTALRFDIAKTVCELDGLSRSRTEDLQSEFIGPGFVHGEPWEEHFIVERGSPQYRLSGCVDINDVVIADSQYEMTVLFASILSLHSEYYEAYKRGYERYFPFPQDAYSRLYSAAIGYAIWAIDELTNDIELSKTQEPLWRNQPFPDWRREGIEKHLNRLNGWLGVMPQIERPMFRSKIGPW